MAPELFGYESLSVTPFMSALEYARHQFIIARSIFPPWVNSALQDSVDTRHVNGQIHWLENQNHLFR